jgi:hypothetical protein
LRRYLIGGVAAVLVLAGAAYAIAQITNGVPSARMRAGSPDTKLAGGWDQEILATGQKPLENPVGIFTQYGYLNDAAGAPCGTPQTSGLKTKTEPDQNTYVVTQSNPGGPQAGYDYGRHFLIQGHEVFANAGNGVGQTNGAYITRINLDVPLNDRRRVTLLGFPAGADGCNSKMGSLDGSTYDPFTGDMLFTGEAGGNANLGGVYSTPLNWTSATAPGVQHTTLQGSMGYGGFEGIQLDDKGNLFIAEDTGGSTVSQGVRKSNSFIFRFLPTNPADLTTGVLQALQVSVGGVPLTNADQDAGEPYEPLTGDGIRRLYSGEALSASWVTVHDTTANGTAVFDANAAAKAAGATPLKRPENLRFFPGSGFKSFAFTITGDTNATAIDAVPDRGAPGAIMRVDMPSSTSTTATIRSLVPGDGAHAAYDSLTFLDKNTLLAGEDRGESLHTAYNALDSTWAFDLTKPYDQRLATSERLIAQGRDPESTDDVSKKEATPAIPDQNDGDNEVTGVLVSDGQSTIAAPFGTFDPGDSPATRMFYTGQHGANVTYELILPGPDSSNTSPGTQGPPGQDGANGSNGQNGAPGANGQNGTPGSNGQNGAPGSQGAPGPQGNPGAPGRDGRDGKNGRDGQTILCKLSGNKVTCAANKSAKRKSARLVRNGRTYAAGTVGRLRRLLKIKRGTYSLVIGTGKTATKQRVRVA